MCGGSGHHHHCSNKSSLEQHQPVDDIESAESVESLEDTKSTYSDVKPTPLPLPHTSHSNCSHSHSKLDLAKLHLSSIYVLVVALFSTITVIHFSSHHHSHSPFHLPLTALPTLQNISPTASLPNSVWMMVVEPTDASSNPPAVKEPRYFELMLQKNKKGYEMVGNEGTLLKDGLECSFFSTITDLSHPMKLHISTCLAVKEDNGKYVIKNPEGHSHCHGDEEHH